MNKQTFGIMIVQGVHIRSWKKVSLDIDLNTGLRISNIDYTKVQQPNLSAIPKDNPFPFIRENYEGWHYYPHIGMGVRFGYVLSSGKISH